jgi:hypothetical protein
VKWSGQTFHTPAKQTLPTAKFRRNTVVVFVFLAGKNIQTQQMIKENSQTSRLPGKQTNTAEKKNKKMYFLKQNIDLKNYCKHQIKLQITIRN